MGFNTKNENGLKTTWGECGCDALRCIHWNNFDMTSIPRVAINDSMSDEETALFERYNENCENTELLWIGLEIALLEAEEKGRKTSTSKASKKRTEEEEIEYLVEREMEAFFDNQGSTDAIRYDDEEIDPFTTHR